MRAWRSLHTRTDDRAVHAWLDTIVRREVARVYGRKSLQTEDGRPVNSCYPLRIRFQLENSSQNCRVKRSTSW